MEDKYTNENGIRELLIKIRAWVNSEKTIALKKVMYNNNSLMFYKNPNATDTDEPEYKVDLPVEKFLEQTKTALVEEFVWNEDDYPGTENPNLDGNPVLVLAVKGNDETTSYSFLNLKYLLNLYQASEETSTVNIAIDEDTNTISAAVNISADEDNCLSVGSDGGLYSVPTDLSEITAKIQELQSYCESLYDRIINIENTLNSGITT